MKGKRLFVQGAKRLWLVKTTKASGEQQRRSANEAHRIEHHSDQRCGTMNGVRVDRQHCIGMREPQNDATRKLGRKKQQVKMSIVGKGGRRR